MNIRDAMDGAVDSLVDLVTTSASSQASDRCTVEDFLAGLDLIEDELTRPDDEEKANPLDANKGDRLAGGFLVDTQREIKVRGASSEDSNSHYRFHIEVVDGDPRYGVALDQEEPSYLDRSEWQKQFHLQLAKTIATIIVKRGS